MDTYNAKPWETRNKEHVKYGSGSKEGGSSYHKQDSQYGAAGEPGSEYMRGKEAKEKEEKEKDPLFENVDEKKKDEQLKEEDIPFRAAKQVFSQNMQEQKKDHEKKKKSLSSIEEAIKKAVEEEKKVIMMD